MALLYITEYKNLPLRFGQLAPVVQEPGHVTQTPVAIGGGSLQSAAFNAETIYVRLHADTPCNVLFGTNPTAIVDVSQKFAADQTEFKAVIKGDKVAVIAAT